MKHAEMDSSGSFPLHLTAYVFFIYLFFWRCDYAALCGAAGAVIAL